MIEHRFFITDHLAQKIMNGNNTCKLLVMISQEIASLMGDHHIHTMLYRIRHLNNWKIGCHHFFYLGICTGASLENHIPAIISLTKNTFKLVIFFYNKITEVY